MKNIKWLLLIWVVTWRQYTGPADHHWRDKAETYQKAFKAKAEADAFIARLYQFNADAPDQSPVFAVTLTHE